MFLPHTTIEELNNLILIEYTINELGVNPNSLGRHSGVEVFFRCVVCGQPHKLSKKRVLDARGLTHPGECRTAFKREGGKRARQNEDPKHKETRKQKVIEKIATDKDNIVKKRQATLIERYGSKNLSEIPEIRETISKGVKKAYEDHKKEIIEKRQETNTKLYGNGNFLASEQGIEILKKKNQENLGVDYPFQNPKFQSTARGIYIQKSGFNNPAQDPNSLKKKEQTNINKYGFINPAQNDTIREKILKTTKERYGVEYHRQLPSERNKLKEWCEANPEKLFTSKAEQEILDWVRLYYSSAQKYRKDSYEIDIFIPDLNLGIEYNGLFWHSESCKPKRYHLDKTKYFKKLNIRIIHIFENQWRDNKEQVKSFLLSAMQKNQNRVFARKCKFVWSDSKEEIQKSHNLLDTFHIQQHTNSTKYVANVYYDDQLIGTATFGKHHRDTTKWVLSRFCTEKNYTIVGGLNKISKIASKNLKADIISWADYSISNGNGYQKAGWMLEETLAPDYFYVKLSTSKIISKQSRQKNIVNTPKELTEYQHAKIDGLERIWDCGKLRFVYKYTN